MADERNDERQKATETAKRRLAASKEARDRTREAQEAAENVKPTPTQEENDLAALGAPVMEKEPDGSPEQASTIIPDPDAPSRPASTETRQIEGRRPSQQQGYQTRAATPQQPPPPRSPES